MSQLIGYALLDSRVALAAWMLTRDHILDNITLYTDEERAAAAQIAAFRQSGHGYLRGDGHPPVTHKRRVRERRGNESSSNVACASARECP